MIAIIWIVLSFVFASVGEKKTIGYWGCFLCCLLLTPVIGLIIGLVSSEKVNIKQCANCAYNKSEKDYYCPRCGKDNEGYTIEYNRVRHFDNETNYSTRNAFVKNKPVKWEIVILWTIVALMIIGWIRSQNP